MLIQPLKTAVCNGKTILQIITYGEMAERSNAAVLKTVDGQLSGGSNPSLSARRELYEHALK